MTSQRPLACIVLAAGKGTRMHSSRPKVLHEIAGRPLISWVLETLKALEPEKIIGVIGPDMSELGDVFSSHRHVIQDKRLGTGDAVKAALGEIEGFEGDVLIVLGDVPFLKKDTCMRLINAAHEDGDGGISVLAARLADPSGYGRIILDKSDEGILAGIVEEKDADDAQKKINLINTGAFCVDAKKLLKWVPSIQNNNAQSEYYITDLPAIAAKEGVRTRIAVSEDKNEIAGVNSRPDLAHLEEAFQNWARRAHMEKGVTLRDPGSTYFAYDTKIAQDVEIGPQVVFGPGVEIAEHSVVNSFCHLEGVRIGKGAQIGPFARLRPGSILEENTKIGNFVETKNARLGAGSKANHLSYIGDATLGAYVNFSAGAITVNYDGFEKHHTSIGDNVMVGCNANLVAPVDIGNGAYVAAGSTITEDVPEDALSVARNRPIIRDQWAARQRKDRQGKKTNQTGVKTE